MSQRLASEPSFETLWSTSILDCRRASSFFSSCNFCTALVDTPADIVDSRHGLVLLPGDGLQFGIPFFDVAAEPVRFGVHAFKTSLQGIQPVGRLHAFVRKFAGLTTKVIKPVAHHLERFAFAFQQGVHLVNIAIAAEDRILFFQAGLFGFQIGNLVTANLDFAAGLLVHAFQGRDGVAQAHNVVVQVVERDGRVLHLAFQIAEGVFVFANGEFLLVNLRLEFRALRFRGLHLVVHAAARRIERREAFLVVLELVETHGQIKFTQARIELLVLAHLLGLGFVHAHGTADASQVVLHAFHVHLHAFQLAHGLFPLLRPCR